MEREYFGEEVGETTVYQLSFGAFNQACHTSASLDHGGPADSTPRSDCTGQRLYAGAHVGLRYFLHYRELFDGCNVLELGCGTGAVGLLLYAHTTLASLHLSDGNQDTLAITDLNIKHLLEHHCPMKNFCTVTRGVLYWTSTAPTVPLDLELFDVAIGCELMYYLTDVPALLHTILRHVHPTKGLFLHAHLFRRQGQTQEIRDTLRHYDWITFEIPHQIFLNPTELIHHPEWYRVRSLISGPKVLLDDLKIRRYPEWKDFVDDEESGGPQSDTFILPFTVTDDTD